jgi:hypothetical protein
MLEGDYRGPSGAFLRASRAKVCVLVHKMHVRKQKPHRDALESQQGSDGCCPKL